jgi:hypothetical protein
MRKEHLETTFGELKNGDLFWTFEPDLGNYILQKVKIGPDRAKYTDGEQIELLYPKEFPVFQEIEVYGWYEYLIWMCISGIILTTLAAAFWIVQKFTEK